ncbi:Hypothetical protein Minf_2073 [Methylacidiphilum infernorum V4]|uniref:Uncharacterized protein n=1 Tax=Methylacidiphilum infernorum (isolate V4) TaxID=481448 RepID=B3DZ35_METI4|nr:Hypothetical protein Minf_2073 [Methylacidiphilum infernorum V4]
MCGYLINFSFPLSKKIFISSKRETRSTKNPVITIKKKGGLKSLPFFFKPACLRLP